MRPERLAKKEVKRIMSPLIDVKKHIKKRISHRRVDYFRTLRRNHKNHILNPNESIRKYGYDILQSKNFQASGQNIQHGNMSVRKHSIQVAKYSLILSKKLNIKVNKEALIRGALLHDYFLYDWHSSEHAGLSNLHGLYHPGIALKNARREYKLNSLEKDIIKKHMWPLTLVPPTCREAWIVSAADKYCSLMETVGIHKGSSPKKKPSKIDVWKRIMKVG